MIGIFFLSILISIFSNNNHQNENYNIKIQRDMTDNKNQSIIANITELLSQNDEYISNFIEKYISDIINSWIKNIKQQKYLFINKLNEFLLQNQENRNKEIILLMHQYEVKMKIKFPNMMIYDIINHITSGDKKRSLNNFVHSMFFNLQQDYQFVRFRNYFPFRGKLKNNFCFQIRNKDIFITRFTKILSKYECIYHEYLLKDIEFLVQKFNSKIQNCVNNLINELNIWIIEQIENIYNKMDQNIFKLYLNESENISNLIYNKLLNHNAGIIEQTFEKLHNLSPDYSFDC